MVKLVKVMVTYKVKTAISKNQLDDLAVQEISSFIRLVIENKDRCRISLAGGSTPANVYKLLGKQELSWDKVDVFLGDERWIEQTNEMSNAFMIRNTLLLSSPGSQANFYSVATTECANPQASADLYHTQLQNFFASSPPEFDLILLGLGDDGHTASLFPYSDSLKVTDKWSTTSFGKGLPRVTLTSPVLSSAKQVLFLVSGSNKKEALKRLLDPLEAVDRTPAKLVKTNSEIIILSDIDASYNG